MKEVRVASFSPCKKIDDGKLVWELSCGHLKNVNKPIKQPGKRKHTCEKHSDLNPQWKNNSGPRTDKTNEQKIARSQRKNTKMRNFQLKKNNLPAHGKMPFRQRHCDVRFDYVRRAADDNFSDCSETRFEFFVGAPSTDCGAGWLKDLCMASHMRLNPL